MPCICPGWSRPLQAKIPKAPLPQGQGRILFVDDEEVLADLWQEMLVHLGYTVTVYTSSPDALAAFRATPHRFDLVITDQTMPYMAGETLVGELRHIRPDIPVILCTGYSPLIDAEQAQVLGIDALLKKPVDVQTFVHTIQRVLAQRRTSQPASSPSGRG